MHSTYLKLQVETSLAIFFKIWTLVINFKISVVMSFSGRIRVHFGIFFTYHLFVTHLERYCCMLSFPCEFINNMD